MCVCVCVYSQFNLGSRFLELWGRIGIPERGRRGAMIDHFGRVRRESPEYGIDRRSALIDHFGRM